MYQAQLKWIKPGWPIRHKFYILQSTSHIAPISRDRHSSPKLTSSQNWQNGNIWWNIAESQTTDIVSEEPSSGRETISRDARKQSQPRGQKTGNTIDRNPSSRSAEPPPSNAGARGKPLTSHDPNRAFNCLPAHTIVQQQQWTNLTATVPGLVIVLTTGRGASGGEGCLIHATANCHQHPTTT